MIFVVSPHYVNYSRRCGIPHSEVMSDTQVHGASVYARGRPLYAIMGAAISSGMGS